MAMAFWGNTTFRCAATVRHKQQPVDARPERRWMQHVRRGFQAMALSGVLLASSVDVFRVFYIQECDARAAISLPPRTLNNRYILVRAGESESESLGIIHSNFKLSPMNGLSKVGKRQALEAAMKLKSMEACESSCIIWASITRRAYEAAEIIGRVNQITQERIVPEYSFLDARGLGAYEGKNLDLVEEVHKMDLESYTQRPPPTTDGTTNESVMDVLVRILQVMSLLEQRYYGDTIVLVSPDSDNLSIIQALLYGADFRRHNEFAFAPGEVREVGLPPKIQESTP